MRILDRYILKSILIIFAGTVFTFAFLFILIDLFSNLQDFIAKKCGVRRDRAILHFIPAVDHCPNIHHGMPHLCPVYL